MTSRESRQATYEKAKAFIDQSQEHREAALEAALAEQSDLARDHWHKHRDAEKQAHDLMHRLMDS